MLQDALYCCNATLISSRKGERLPFWVICGNCGKEVAVDSRNIKQIRMIG